jgi:transcriptional regulator ATRX
LADSSAESEVHKKVSKVILEFDSDKKKPLVSIHPKLVSHLKPHQAEGIKFMWNCAVESVQAAKDKNTGNGTILAHCKFFFLTLSCHEGP